MSEFRPKVWMACPLCGKQSPMPDPDVRAWVDLTEAEIDEICLGDEAKVRTALQLLKERNT